MRWKQLQQENAPLRIYLNGKLQSASENIYDSFILREVDEQADEFSEANLIGNVLGKNQLGIGDAWIADGEVYQRGNVHYCDNSVCG